MHVLLVPVGSHGDVHPFLSLGLALKARGHQVTLITNVHFADMVAGAGIDVVPLGTEQMFLEATDHPRLWDPKRGLQIVIAMSARLMQPLHDLIMERYVPGQTVVAAPAHAFGARVAQEAHGVPLVTVHLQPAAFLSAIVPPVLPIYGLMMRLPIWGRRALYRALEVAVAGPIFGPHINPYRSRLGLPKVRRFLKWWNSSTDILGLFPAWFAPPQADWPPQVTLTSFPLFDESHQPEIDQDLQEFLDAGPPPVVFTAGSAMKHGSEFFKAAVEACVSLNRRALLLARFPEQVPQDLPLTVRHFSYVPFGRLLPHAAALVHHGGIGTTAQGLAAGLPQLVMPMAHDQPDNAARLERLGVGRTLTPARFQGPAVARELSVLLTDPSYAEKARQLSSRLDPRRALEESCRVLEMALDRANATPGSVLPTKNHHRPDRTFS